MKTEQLYKFVPIEEAKNLEYGKQYLTKNGDEEYILTYREQNICMLAGTSGGNGYFPDSFGNEEGLVCDITHILMPFHPSPKEGHCPTCGCEVKIEGNTTQYYVPVVSPKEISEEEIVAQFPEDNEESGGQCEDRCYAQREGARWAIERLSLPSSCSKTEEEFAEWTSKKGWMFNYIHKDWCCPSEGLANKKTSELKELFLKDKQQ